MKFSTSHIDAQPQTTRSHFWALVAIIVGAVLFGGGGSRYGLANLAVQLIAIGALYFHRQAWIAFWSNAPVFLRALVAASILLPALYLIPLPPSVWTALPGRDLVSQSLELVGEIGWTTASVDPRRTLLALTALITPLAILLIGLSAQRDRLVPLGWLIVGFGLANVGLGAVQVVSNGELGLLYPETPMPGVLFGTFANRNTTGLFLVGCLALAALLPAPQRIARTALPLRVAVCLVLVVAVVLTRSRTALVLTLLPFLLLTARAVLAQHSAQDRSQGSRTMRLPIALAGAFLILGGAASLVVAAPGRLGDVVERFQDDRTDARAYIWDDAAFSAQRYWPIGAGMGTFDDVFQVDESLENIAQRRAGRAHNDYLEIAIEAGLPGLFMIGAWIAMLGWLTWHARQSNDRWVAWSGSLILLTIALQSITDYPLRNQSMLALAGFALVILIRFGSAPRKSGT